jgi:hypothetical protein
VNTVERIGRPTGVSALAMETFGRLDVSHIGRHVLRGTKPRGSPATGDLWSFGRLLTNGRLHVF